MVERNRERIAPYCKPGSKNDLWMMSVCGLRYPPLCGYFFEMREYYPFNSEEG
jgi:hypothetical protein